MVFGRSDLFYYLRNRWARLFGSTCDVVLFDLTSTYFEVDGVKAFDSELQRYGYSRDKRGDCLRVVIALVLTPDGFQLSYEVLPGNTNDRNTQMPFIKRLEQKYGKIGNLWLMDRGVPSEETLKVGLRFCRVDSKAWVMVFFLHNNSNLLCRNIAIP